MPKDQEMKADHLSERQFRALIENAHEGIVLYDEKGNIKYITPAVSKITGFKKAEAVGKKGESFLHPDDIAATRAALNELRKNPGRSITLFQRIRHKKGHYLWAESRLTNHTHVPEIRGIVSNFRDITEKKQAEESAKKSRELLEVINRNISEGICMGVMGEAFIYANEAFLRMTGYVSFSELEIVQLRNLLAEKGAEKKLNSLLKKNQSIKGFETLFRRKNGSFFWGVLNARLINHEGSNEYFVASIRDISRERDSETKLLESKTFLDNIINTVAAPIFVKDDMHRWVLVNDSFCKIIGKPRKSVIGKSDPDFFSPDEVKLFWKADRETLRTGKTNLQEEQLTVKGRKHHLLTVKSRYLNKEGEKFVIGFITDITHLKNAEEEIKHLHENLEGVLESSEESIFSVDKNLNYTAFNQRHKSIMKILYGADVEIGKNKIKLFKNHPDAKWVKGELLRALNGEHFVTDHYQNFPRYKGFIQTTYNPIRGENDEVKGVAVFVQDITQRKRYEQIINSINASLRGVMESTSDGIFAIDRNYNVTLYNNSFAKGFKKIFGIDVARGENIKESLPVEIRKMIGINIEKAFSGERISIEAAFPGEQTLETAFNPIYDNSGGVAGAALFIRNVSERKKMEEHNKMLNLELLEQNVQLATQEEHLKATLKELSDRNFELDQLMYKTSHDLRSPLSSIIGLINLANLDNDPGTFKEYLTKIEGRAKKLDEFIRSMLDYARVNRAEIDHEDIEIKELINNCISELEYMDNSKRLKIRMNIDRRLETIRGDKLRLKIIFSNIISNAVKYMNNEASSYLKISVKPAKTSINLEFTDNGIGIKKEYLPKIFNMFFRATDRSQGSGLGMYIVKQAVERMKGSISLTSDYGKGTQIRINLPKP